MDQQPVDRRKIWDGRVAEVRIIKKYPNRRLYDTGKSRYVTIDDVRQLVVDGVDFKVIDTPTEADITRNVLIQIIIEQESGKEALFTTDMLAKFIRMSHDAAQDIFSRYLDQSMRFFMDQQEAMRNQIAGMISGVPAGTLAEIAQRNLELWQEMQQRFLGSAELGAGTAGPASRGQDNEGKESG